MTDDFSAYGLGALPDAPDERDYPLSALYASEGLTASVVLPASYAAPGMPPVLNQHATPMCVAYSSSAMKSWQDRPDGPREGPRMGCGLRSRRPINLDWSIWSGREETNHP